MKGLARAGRPTTLTAALLYFAVGPAGEHAA
jgi:hypothetical protein